MTDKFRYVLCFFIFTLFNCNTRNSQDIRPYSQNPRYWQYKGKPVLLLGATKNDNLFQTENLEKHLDSLKHAGGNYIRNTMSSRDDGDLWPFYQRPDDGLYDLDLWNDRYWQHFESLLQLTAQRDIFVQIEIWDRFDYSRDPWRLNPFNPGNNINYTVEESGLATDYPQHPSSDVQPFFHSIEGLPLYNDKLRIIQNYQQKFVDKMLFYTKQYGNVLYCMDNETSTPPRWGQYWMDYIRLEAQKQKKTVYTTDMFDHFFKPRQCESCLQAIRQPEFYGFLDISQINSRNFAQAHWDTMQWVLQQRDKYALRPVNNVKVYGGNNTGWGSGSNQDGIERFCRNIMGGCASARHHRPPTGNGLNHRAQSCLKAVRLVEQYVRFWDTQPAMDKLSDRQANEAYLTAKENQQFVLYFPTGGQVTLDITGSTGDFECLWISVADGELGTVSNVNTKKIELTTPDSTGWFAVITK